MKNDILKDINTVISAFEQFCFSGKTNKAVEIYKKIFNDLLKLAPGLTRSQLEFIFYTRELKNLQENDEYREMINQIMETIKDKFNVLELEEEDIVKIKYEVNRKMLQIQFKTMNLGIQKAIEEKEK